MKCCGLKIGRSILLEVKKKVMKEALYQTGFVLCAFTQYDL